MAQGVWNAVTGQVDPNDLQYTQWEDQTYNPGWNVTAQQGTAQGYTGQGYDANTLGDAQTYNAATGQYESSQAFQDILSQAMGASQDFMDPNSDWSRGQQSIVAEQAGALAGQQTAQQSSEMAARGMGGGGLRGLLGNRAQQEAGSQARMGATNIATQGAQLGLQAMGQAGTMAGQQDQLSQQQALANQAAQNQASQFSAGAQNQFSLANQQALNQANQFNVGAQNQANQWTAGQQNQMSQFNVGQQNQSNQFNASNQMNYQSWNESQAFAADQFNASQYNAQVQSNAANQAGAISGFGQMATAKIIFMCVPEGTKIDTPNGCIPIEDLKSGDIVNGYGEKPVSILQKHEYKENPEIKRFLKIYFDDGDTIDLCDMHRLKDIRSREYNVGDSINGKKIVNIKWYNGVTRSYDLLTEDKGYRISGLPVNSMIEEMYALISVCKEVENGI